MMVNERLKLVREFLGLSQKELANELGITERTIRNYEAGKIEIPKTIILALQSLFNINPNWLLTGQGEMFLKKEEGNKYIGSAVGEGAVFHSIGGIFAETIRKVETKTNHTENAGKYSEIEKLIEREQQILKEIRERDPNLYIKALKKLEADIKQLEELFLT